MGIVRGIDATFPFGQFRRMTGTPPRFAARAIIVHDDRLLLVNAYRDPQHNLMCAPGGGVEGGASLRDNLRRELMEECGLTISVGAPCLVNEFTDDKISPTFHQIEVFFRCEIVEGTIDDNWVDVDGVVDTRRWVSRDEFASLNTLPPSLGTVVWGDRPEIPFDTNLPVTPFEAK